MVDVNALRNRNAPTNLSVGQFDASAAGRDFRAAQAGAQQARARELNISAAERQQADELLDDFAAATLRAETEADFEAQKLAFAQRRGIDPSSLAGLRFQDRDAILREVQGAKAVLAADASARARTTLTASQRATNALKRREQNLKAIEQGIDPATLDRPPSTGVNRLAARGAPGASPAAAPSTTGGVSEFGRGEAGGQARVVQPTAVQPADTAPRQKLTKGARTAAQKSLQNAEQQVKNVERLRTSFDREFLTRRGKIKAFLAREAARSEGLPGIGAAARSIADAAGADNKFLEGFTRFTQQIEQVFNAYRKEITGAAAAVAELDRLKKAVLNADNSPPEFEAALNLFEETLQEGIQIKRELLRKGIRVGSPEFGQEFDREFGSRVGAQTSNLAGKSDSLLGEPIDLDTVPNSGNPADGQSLAVPGTDFSFTVRR